MSHGAAALRYFQPGQFIRVDDVMTGIRKLALVTEAGCAYLDLDTDDATPLPIYAALNPEEAGNMLEWGLRIIETKPEQHEKWVALCECLLNCGEGVLTYSRAAYWAFDHLNFNYESAIEAARKETAAIAQGRAVLDGMVAQAGA